MTDKNGIQLSVHTARANEYASKGLLACIEKQDRELSVESCYADKGLEKTHTQHLLEAIAYSLYRAPGIIVANAKK